MIKNTGFLIAFILLNIFLSANAQNKVGRHPAADSAGKYRDIYPDTWVATDGVGRTMPDRVFAPLKNDHKRVVGMFYVTWHTADKAKIKAPYTADVTKILAKDPNARFDAKSPAWTYWFLHSVEPENGYFLSADEYVIRKDMSMLSDAGVDVIILDVTNAEMFWNEWMTMFKVMEKMKAEGNKVPQFCFWTYTEPIVTVTQSLYDGIYKPKKYQDLWFYWDNKPLLLYKMHRDPDDLKHKNPNPHYDADAVANKANPHYGDPDYTEKFYKDYTQEVKNFFTARTMWWGYYENDGKRFAGTEDNWSFGYQLQDKKVRDLIGGNLVSLHKGQPEEMAVTPAQHSCYFVGKSWSLKDGEPAINQYDLPIAAYVPWLKKKVEHPEGYGIYFQERWDEALKQDPPFIYLNDWNELTAWKFDTGNGNTAGFMDRKSSYYFVDQYNTEFNRTIEPMKGGYTDNYYMQMAENIRRYKGARAIPVLKGYAAIKMDGQFTDWATIKTEYRDTRGDVAHRDFNGYGGLHYTDTSGRNDIVTSKVGVNANDVYFYAETDSLLTPSSGKNWMLLLIDADKNANTGWNGYDYMVNKHVINNTTTTLMKYEANAPGDHWVEVSKVQYRYKGNKIEIAIPKNLLHLTGNAFSFDFHWADNPQSLSDPIIFCTTGDNAPNRRFNYRCIWQK
jgi:hypothetical protein